MRLAIPALLLLAPAFGRDWQLLRSPHFELITDAGEKAGRDAIAHLEQARAFFSKQRELLPGFEYLPATAGGRPRAFSVTPLPIRVFLLSDRDFRRFGQAAPVKGFYQSAAERDYIAVIESGAETPRILRHDFVHLVLQHAGPPLPKWLEEGTAEFYSTLSFGRNGVSLGAPVENHLLLLARSTWLEPPELTRVSAATGLYDDAGRTGIFYAQSWAFMHMLHQSPAYRAKLPRFFYLLQQAESPLAAFSRAFGQTVDQALASLKPYLSRRPLPQSELTGDVGETLDVTVEPRSRFEAVLAQTELLALTGQGEAADRMLREQARTEAASPDLEIARGLLALARASNADARRHFEEAIRLGATDAAPHFELAMLERERGAPREEVRRLLTEAVKRNAKHAEAHFLLGLMASEEGRHRDAIPAMLAAAEVQPRQSTFWHALAVAWSKTGDRENAYKAARRARDSAKSPSELEMAAALSKLVVAPDATPAELPAEVVTPATWNMPKGDSRAEGALERIDCLGARARLHVRSPGGQRFRLTVDRPDQVAIRGAEGISTELSCGPQGARPVVVEYRATSGDVRAGDGVVTAIEFRQKLK